jgi:hypothetical protein
VYFFSAVKNDIASNPNPYVPAIERILIVNQEDLKVAGMYPDVTKRKEVSFLAYRSKQDAGAD